MNMDWTKPSSLRMALVAMALVLGGVGQLIIVGDSPRWALTPYLVAMAAMALALLKQPLSPSDQESGDLTQKDPPASAQPPVNLSKNIGLERRAVLGMLGLSALMLALSLTGFAGALSNTLAWYAYGLSMVLLLLALPGLEARWTGLVHRVREDHGVSVSYRSLAPWAVLAVILLLALGARLYNLQELPAGLWYDEADNLSQARQILADPGSTPVFVRSTALPSLFLMPIAAMIDLTGITPATGRLISVAFGLAGIVAVFLLVRLLGGPFLGLVAAFLTTVMRWDIIWSRIGMHGITATLFAALTAYLTLRAMRSGRLSDFGFAGASLGLGMWFYTSFRLFPLVVGVLLLHYLVFQRPEIRRFSVKVLVMVVVSLAVAAPVVQFAAKDSDDFFARTRTTSVFSGRPLDDAVVEIGKSIVDHSLMFNREGDPNPRHNLPGEPMLDFFSGVLLVLGLGVALTRWRNPAMFVLPIWILFMILPGALTLPWEAPQSLRSIGALPAVVAIITVAIGAVWRVGRSASWVAVRWGTSLLVAVLLGLIAFVNIDTYFGEQARDPEVYAAFSTDESLIARDMLQKRNQGYDILTSRQFKFSLVALLLGQSTSYDVIRAPTGIPIDPSRVSRGVSIYLEPREAGVYRLLKSYYPDGQFSEVRPPGGGNVLYYSAVIEKDQLESRLGLLENRTLADGTAQESIRPETEALWRLELSPGEVPFDMVWEGALHVVEAGEYLLTLEGGTDAQVLLDGLRILWAGRTSVRLEPAVGLHLLEIRDKVRGPAGFLRVMWQPPGGPLETIPTGHLYHGSVRPMGLAGSFYLGGEESGAADAMRVTPAMNTFYYDPVVPEPYLAVWEGTLTAPTRGEYQFEVGGAGVIKLSLDGRPTTQSPPGESIESTSTVQLSPGPHNIRVEYLSEKPPSQFQVLWSLPGGSLTPIPIESLSPAPRRTFRLVDND